MERDREQTPEGGSKGRSPQIDCRACRHFYITHEPAFPYGCRVVGFKSRLMPSTEVYMNSGIACQLFQEKAKRCPSP